MPVLTFADLERTIRSSLDGATYPSDAKTPWNPAYPTRGQCGVVTLVVNDLLGGELMRGEVHVDTEMKRLHAEYELLHRRVFDALTARTAHAGCRCRSNVLPLDTWPRS